MQQQLQEQEGFCASAILIGRAGGREHLKGCKGESLAAVRDRGPKGDWIQLLLGKGTASPGGWQAWPWQKEE